MKLLINVSVKQLLLGRKIRHRGRDFLCYLFICSTEDHVWLVSDDVSQTLTLRTPGSFFFVAPVIMLERKQ